MVKRRSSRVFGAALAKALAKRYKDFVEFRILGPLEVADGERAISFDAPKQRALLGLLLLHPNEVVSSERLIDELWGERAPATAAKVVQTYISQLRRALGPDVIATRPPGYLLRIEEEALDAERFRRLAAEARRLAADGKRERADGLYREALALWRGPPLADVAFESFARNEVERLGEERLDALSAWLDCELTLGHHDELVTELETLVRQHPLRERLRAQLMLALYRSGRQADALAAYQDARRTLVDELGLEPSRELQDLEKGILTHDPALEAVRPSEPASARPGDGPKATAGKTVTLARLRWKPVLAVTALLVLAVALGLAFALHRGHPAAILLAPDSVGFIDANSGAVTRSIPVGRVPRSLTVADDSLWVGNFQDQTVIRINRTSGRTVTIPVGGHPLGLAALQGDVWVWTLEGSLVQIDPRFNEGAPLELGPRITRLTAPSRGVAPATLHNQVGDGRIMSGGGFLWVTVPLTTVIRINPVKPGRSRVIVPDDGAGGAITYRGGEAWVAGYDDVFPIAASTGVPGRGITVGPASSLAFGAGSLWVVSGGAMDQGVVRALRRVDLRGRLVEATIAVGRQPIAVAVAGGSIWVADGSDRAIQRVDPAKDRIVETIPLGGRPAALASDENGVWVAVK